MWPFLGHGLVNSSSSGSGSGSTSSRCCVCCRCSVCVSTELSHALVLRVSSRVLTCSSSISSISISWCYLLSLFSVCVNGTFSCTGTPCFVTCSDDEFKCPSTPVKCIPHSLRCDGVKHCSDGADERDCGR